MIWSTLVGLVIAAAASYGIGITDELRELLVYALPVILAAIVARQRVTPVPKAEAAVEDAKADAYKQGVQDGARPTASGATVDLTTHTMGKEFRPL